MLRTQGADSAPHGDAPKQGLQNTSAPSAPRNRPVPAPPPFPLLAAPEFSGARTTTAIAHRTGTDVVSVRAGALAQAWVTPAAIGVVLALTFVWMVLQVISAGPFIAWDWAAREWVYARRAQGGWVTFLEVQAFITGERWATVPVVMGTAALLAYQRGRLRPLYAVMAGLATIAAIGYPVKFGLGRSSPETGVDLLHAGGQAFPSGHAANTAFTATMVVFLLFGSAGFRPDQRRFRRGVAFVVALLAVSGPLVAWMGYHWLSDIPGGWLMGFIAVCVSLTVLHWPDRGTSAASAAVDRTSPLVADAVRAPMLVPATGFARALESLQEPEPWARSGPVTAPGPAPRPQVRARDPHHGRQAPAPGLRRVTEHAPAILYRTTFT